MMWEEKIDKLKKQFSAQELHVPFTDWSAILKKIEDRFIIKQNSMYVLTNWTANIKGRHFVRSISPGTLLKVIGELDENYTYWFVVQMENAPTSKLFVCSCSPKAIQSLALMTSNDFFIVDKRLGWFAHFHHAKDQIEIHKSGASATPFDKLSF